jgi:hypothetical protein
VEQQTTDVMGQARRTAAIVVDNLTKERDESMSTATTVQAHIAYKLIEGTDHQVVIIEFVSGEITVSRHARELGEQLDLLIRPQPVQYFVIDCTGVRALGNSAFSEILTFAQKARAVWVCNLDHTLRFGASLIGLENWVKFAADRRAAIEQAEMCALWDQDETVDYPARARETKDHTITR